VVTGKRLADPIWFDPATIDDESMLLDFIQTICFPQFHGLAMPLLKWGLPIRPVQLDNVTRFDDYLSDCRFLVLSYEFLKPSGAEVNEALVRWIREGGSLFYVGDGSDPYHAAKLWWREAGFRTPAEHLFEAAGLGREPEEGSYNLGAGRIHILKECPARLCLEKDLSDSYREQVRSALAQAGIRWDYRNDLTLRRGPYIISGVMDESCSEAPRVFRGRFVDLKAEGLPILTEKAVAPDQCTVLVDLDRVEGTKILGTAARVENWEEGEHGLRFTLRTADRIRSHTRIRLEKAPKEVTFPGTWQWDAESGTLLLSYHSDGSTVSAQICY
jgi:hypothetical protein